eukprot:Blabericola_migrator_1__8202@NODE_4242_length_1262_cov_47_265272_g2623_i0_p2_GENE_NODE_4242_length_1262_cov_47_265272_g2623_i0NODE_4242_length_1262_cov_47_265272_g2623_i0_p2_ORF_typecomplete_len162_score24_01Chromo/PF00385_24/1_3e09Chromo/PF00385_24/3_4e03_NODE_4242_length_1262_cov_47_265272_g2623_i06961181
MYFFGFAMVSREMVKRNRSTFIRVFGDVVYSIDTLSESAFDDLLRGRLKKARMYLDVLEEAVGGKALTFFRLPKPVPVTVDVGVAESVVGSEDDKVYEIEEIRGIQAGHDGKDTYLVKWKGYEEMTWEPRATIDEADAEDLILLYKRTLNADYSANSWTDV